MFQFTLSTSADLPLIYQLYQSAIDYQKKNGFELWPLFDRSLIEKDIEEKRHWKIMEGEEVICIFSVTYNDPVIWGEKDKDPALYLHRICINPQHKGKGMMRVIRNWALKHGREKRKKFLRMDTWGNNKTIRDYYIRCGFTYIGQIQIGGTDSDPLHYGGNYLSLFEDRLF